MADDQKLSMREMSEDEVWLSEKNGYRPSRRLIFIALPALAGMVSVFIYWCVPSRNLDEIEKNEARDTPMVFKNPKASTAKKMKNVFDMLNDESMLGGKLR